LQYRENRGKADRSHTGRTASARKGKSVMLRCINDVDSLFRCTAAAPSTIVAGFYGQGNLLSYIWGLLDEVKFRLPIGKVFVIAVHFAKRLT
jgi:hypothetical protein